MRLRATIALVLAGLGFALLGPVAAADAYPVVTCSTLAVSTTTPAVGESITVTGANFKPNRSVRLELDSAAHPLKTVTSGVDGSFSTQVTLPAGVTGSHSIVAVGGGLTAAGCPVDPAAQLHIQGSGVGGVATSGAAAGAGGQSNPGSTAFTGVNVLLMLIAAGILILLGTMLNRRNVAKHSTPRNNY
ncbi:MAG TPA: hypothetical protein VGN18_11965 [Jatrophihabitans sp.]|jgi:hypothetical protein|uniref:hypothetical protein n=1 Tax=Jatrophihabitans sp. TaxID=1932789 RepID=UPI002E0A2D33|nr:hypothetical protein [Jatrophihabitans sp.]